MRESPLIPEWWRDVSISLASRPTICPVIFRLRLLLLLLLFLLHLLLLLLLLLLHGRQVRSTPTPHQPRYQAANRKVEKPSRDESRRVVRDIPKRKRRGGSKDCLFSLHIPRPDSGEGLTWSGGSGIRRFSLLLSIDRGTTENGGKGKAWYYCYGPGRRIYIKGMQICM